VLAIVVTIEVGIVVTMPLIVVTIEVGIVVTNDVMTVTVTVTHPFT
jgi:hypothetical protein